MRRGAGVEGAAQAVPACVPPRLCCLQPAPARAPPAGERAREEGEEGKGGGEGQEAGQSAGEARASRAAAAALGAAGGAAGQAMTRGCMCRARLAAWAAAASQPHAHARPRHHGAARDSRAPPQPTCTRQLTALLPCARACAPRRARPPSRRMATRWPAAQPPWPTWTYSTMEGAHVQECWRHGPPPGARTHGWEAAARGQPARCRHCSTLLFPALPRLAPTCSCARLAAPLPHAQGHQDLRLLHEPAWPRVHQRLQH